MNTPFSAHSEGLSCTRCLADGAQEPDEAQTIQDPASRRSSRNRAGGGRNAWLGIAAHRSRPGTWPSLVGTLCPIRCLPDLTRVNPTQETGETARAWSTYWRSLMYARLFTTIEVRHVLHLSR